MCLNDLTMFFFIYQYEYWLIYRFDATLSKCQESKHVAETLLPDSLKNLCRQPIWDEASLEGHVITKQVLAL